MKRAYAVLFLILISSMAYAADMSVMKKIARLEDQKKSLSASYGIKQQELADLTMKIRDIDSQINELREARS